MAKGNPMKQLRLALLGFGTVGQWLAEALQKQQAWLQQEFGLVVTLISVATAHHGLIYRDDGLDIPTLLELVTTRQPLTAHPKVTHWTNVLEGLQATGGAIFARHWSKGCMSSPPAKVLWPWQDWISSLWHESMGSSCAWSPRSCRGHPC